MSFAFEKTPFINLSCKLVPVTTIHSYHNTIPGLHRYSRNRMNPGAEKEPDQEGNHIFMEATFGTL